MLGYVLASDYSLAVGAFNTYHLAGGLMLKYVSSRPLDLAVGCSIACDPLYLLTVLIVVLQ